ncbi:hypothetical protein D3C80_2088310 [compost metagenome]
MYVAVLTIPLESCSIVFIVARIELFDFLGDDKDDDEEDDDDDEEDDERVG